MFKFLHAADIHLDSPLLRLGEYDDAPAELLRTATRLALANLVDLAIAEEVDFVVIAGDVYDGDWDDVRTGLAMVQQMTRLRDAQIPVFVIAGNHDAATKMTHNVPLPENVTYFGHRKPETRRLERVPVALHGQSFSKQAVTDNLARGYPPAVANVFNIGVLHTSLDGREGHANYAPCTLEDLRSKRYDYWALGHIHQREQLCERPWIGFSGNLQGRHIREEGAKGALLVRVDDSGGGEPKVEVEFRELDVVRWLRVEVDVGKLTATEGLLDLVRERLAAERNEHRGKTLAVRLVVTGATPFHAEWQGRKQKWDVRLRAVAADAGSAHSAGELWLEKIKWETRSAAGGRVGGRAGEAGANSQDSAAEFAEGPLAELNGLVAEYESSDSALAELANELRDLRDKLPAELTQGDDPLVVDSPAFLRSLVGELAPFLRDQLNGGKGENEVRAGEAQDA